MHVYLPTPSLRECSSSVSGAVAPSASIASAASLSWASSHSTPAATRWMFSTGEYSNYRTETCQTKGSWWLSVEKEIIRERMKIKATNNRLDISNSISNILRYLHAFVWDCKSWSLYFTVMLRFYLDKEWNGVKPSDDDSIVDISCQDVQSSCATFHYFLHTHTLLYVCVGKIKTSNTLKACKSTKKESMGFCWLGYTPQTAVGCLPCWCASGCPGEPWRAVGPIGGWPPAPAEHCGWLGIEPSYESDRLWPR